MTLVMGQRNQLVWDIPVADSYELNRAIYRIPEAEFRQTLAELNELLDLEPLLTKPVRNLSLGERMKCEIAGSLLHRPRVLFLDEPTLGLDVTAQRRIRGFIGEYAARHDATVLLTSHYMADVEALAERVIVIHHGALLFDGALAELVERFSPHKTLTVDLEHPVDRLERFGEVVSVDDCQVTLRVPKGDAAAATARLLAELPVVDLSVTDPPVDEVIDRVFSTSAGTEPEPAPEPAPEREREPALT
jgi:ABC-2 type transport system ATP-binding protein